MSYKDIELDEEELFSPKELPQFLITDAEAIKFLRSLASTYRQFSKFPKSHRSYKSLQHTGAMYEFILRKFESNSRPASNNP
jgi:hypothetical protein